MTFIRSYRTCPSGTTSRLNSLALEWMTTHGPKPSRMLSEEERQAGMKELLQFAGIHKGAPEDSKNERIDADLADEYLNTHEPGRQ